MREKLKVLDLFSGIGGFSLGLERTGGFETIAFCEIDNYCQRVLRKHWPNVFIHSDIRKLGRQHFEGWQWPDVITGGFPCQPFSSAGKRQGTADDRYLWPEMLRVIRELKPSFVIGENVAGLIAMDDGRVLDQVCSSLEAEGYEVLPPLVVPACAFGALHQRERIWIIAHSQHDGCYAAQNRRSDAEAVRRSAKGEVGSEQSAGICMSRIVAEVCNAASQGFPDWANGEVGQPAPLTEFERPDGREIERDFCGMAHGVSDRVHRIKGLGNAIVPQIAEYIGHCILRASAIPEAVAPRAFSAEKRPDKTKNVLEGE